MLAPCTATADPGTQVKSFILKEGAIYRLNVAQGGLVALRFPFGCLKAWAPRDKVALEVHPQLANHVIAITPGGVPLGTVINGNIACEQGISIALAMTVVQESRTSPRVDFAWDAHEKSLAQQMVAHAVAAAQQLCAKRPHSAENLSHSHLDFMLRQAREAFSYRGGHYSARTGHVVVHVDAQKRLGDFGLLEFRVQNRETGPIRLTAVEVVGSGTAAAPAVVSLEAAAQDKVLETAESVDQADSADATDDAEPSLTQAIVIPSSLIKAGVTVASSVIFPWPADTSRFTLFVRFFAPEPRVVEVQSIDF